MALVSKLLKKNLGSTLVSNPFSVYSNINSTSFAKIIRIYDYDFSSISRSGYENNCGQFLKVFPLVNPDKDSVRRTVSDALDNPVIHPHKIKPFVFLKVGFADLFFDVLVCIRNPPIVGVKGLDKMVVLEEAPFFRSELFEAAAGVGKSSSVYMNFRVPEESYFSLSLENFKLATCSLSKLLEESPTLSNEKKVFLGLHVSKALALKFSEDDDVIPTTPEVLLLSRNLDKISQFLSSSEESITLNGAEHARQIISDSVRVINSDYVKLKEVEPKHVDNRDKNWKRMKEKEFLKRVRQLSKSQQVASKAAWEAVKAGVKDPDFWIELYVCID